ncbi:MAG: cytochrome c3 family protein [Phycisphaeraceae bacterium]|nr:cytochrome c3 family protein [Phycisphaeraceae bacterium]
MSPPTDKFVFPTWANYLLPALILAGLGAATYVPTLAVLSLSPGTKDVGYAPTQPVPFSHAMHAGQLGMDCRYCHNTVEKAGFAAIPPTQTCMNCHAHIRTTSERLAPVRDSYATGKSIDWVKVHDLADYVYFNHSAHLAKGVGCVSCHGRIDKMDVVHNDQPLTMGWCLECHRAPEKHLRPRDQITNMTWDPLAETGKTQLQLGLELKKQYNIHDSAYMTSCSTCHR